MVSGSWIWGTKKGGKGIGRPAGKYEFLDDGGKYVRKAGGREFQILGPASKASGAERSADEWNEE